MNEITKANISPKFVRHGPVGRLGEGISTGFTWIGYKGKTFSLKQGGETKIFVGKDGHPLPYLDCVIVGYNEKISKIWYEGAYTDGSMNPPDCQSLDGEVPLPNVPKPQSRSCHNCPQNQWGSALNGGRGKACQDHRRLAILLMPSMTERILEKPLTEPIYFKVPPGSLGSLKLYDDSLAHRGIPWYAVITRISFAPNQMFRLNFNDLKPLNDADADVILPLLEDSRTKNILRAVGEIEESAPAIPPAADEPGESGLLAAFGRADTPATASTPVQAPARRGRPPGSLNKPKTLEGQVVRGKMVENEVAVDTSSTRPLDEVINKEQDAGGPGPEVPWEGEETGETDGQVSDRVRNLLKDHQSKLDQMMK